MISDNAAFDEFISEYRWAVLTTLRQNGTPVSSVVAYAREGDELVVSTPGRTFKRKTLTQDDRVNLCVINNEEPFNFVAIEGKAFIQTDEIVEATRKVFKKLEATGYQEPEDLEGWLTSQQRVILRITADRVYGVIR